MVYLIAFAIFVALSAANWHASIAFYKASVEGSDPTRSPHYGNVAFIAVALVSLTCFIPFVGGYPAGCLVWFFASFGGLALPPGQAIVLFGYLAMNSLLTRLLALGAMSCLGV